MLCDVTDLALDSEINRHKLNYQLNDGFYLYGAGHYGAFVADFCAKSDMNLLGFIDSHSDKVGTKIGKYDVYGVDSKDINAKCPILITARHSYFDVYSQLKSNLNFTSTPVINFDAWYTLDNLSAFRNLRDNFFCDKKSRLVMNGLMMCMLTGNREHLFSIAEPNQYFCLPPFFNSGDEVFVDAGAYVGDTIEKFILAHNGAFKKIYGFEPGPLQHKSLVARCKRLAQDWAIDSESIMPINAALGIKNDCGYISQNANHLLGSQIVPAAQGNGLFEIANVVTLDHIFKDTKFSSLKADVEGMEMGMLNGGYSVLKRDLPKFAISVYHRPDDLFTISNFILNLSGSYKFAIRHHSGRLMDTTLYAWI